MDRYDLAARGENDGLWDWNLATGRIHFSPRWVSMLGYEAQEVGNTPEDWFKRIHPEDLTGIRSGIESHLADTTSQFENQHRMLHKDGTYRWMCCRGMITRDESGRAILIAGSHSNVTAEKVVDPLTGLPNRLLLQDRLSRSVERARRHNDFLFAVLILDLDRSESLIERLGPAGGDLLLVAAARRLETCLRAGDTVARLGGDHVVARAGGDEFIILLDSLNEVGEAKTVAERVLKEISAPFELDGHEVFLSASIGIALSATGYRSAEEALRDADIALYRAKSLGKTRCEVFDTALLESVQSKRQLEADLHGALERGEFSVFYQPIISLASRRIAGFEALMRWNHPTRGMIPPQDFIPASERTGLIVPLGRWILHEACSQLKAWQEKLGVPRDVRISVNISSTQFRQPSLVDQVRDVLIDVDLEPNCLMLELTEGMVMENPEAAGSSLMQLRVMGVQIALDDFGTGYSSLTYLRRFPLDFLKIDRAFVRTLGLSPDNLEIIRTISRLAHQLGLRVIAEGIENEAQLDVIRSLDCEFAQGFLFSRAVDREKAEELLARDLKQGSNPAGEEAVNEKNDAGIAYGAEADLPAPAVDPGPQEPAAQPPKTRFTRRSFAVIAGATALLLLLVGGWIARINRFASPPVAYSSPPGQVKVADAPLTMSYAEQPSEMPATPASAKKPAEKPAPKETRKPAASKVTPQPPPPAPMPATTEPEAFSYPVIHDHLIGSCKGTLEISKDNLSFISEKGKDSFTLNYQECSYSLDGEQLSVTGGSKTYHFKSANAAGKAENRSQLQEIVQTISKFHPPAANKKH